MENLHVIGKRLFGKFVLSCMRYTSIRYFFYRVGMRKGIWSWNIHAVYDNEAIDFISAVR